MRPSAPPVPAAFLSSLSDDLRDRYVVECELGRGGMATVYLARDLRHRRAVALKVLHPELAHALGPDRFLREIETAAGLQHPHILPLFDSGEAAGLLYYVMPYVEGESLRHRLAREKQIQVDEALEIVRQVASALAYAHVRGVIHRDVKPENILLEGDQAVVADFGIARAVSASGGERLTGTGLALGTPAYMSPEQASGERDLDSRSDIYSLGCVLYEMLAGHPPFLGATAQQVMARHATDPVPPLRTVRPSVTLALEEAVMKALAKLPADRFPSAERFGQALMRVDQGLEHVTALSGPAGRARLQMPVRRVTLLAAAILVIAGAIVPLLLRGLPARSRALVARHTQLTFVGNVERQEISPDGKFLAYVERGDSNRLVVRDLVGGSDIPIATTGAFLGTLRWSPDGASILYTGLDTVGRSAGVLFPRLGGSAQTLPSGGPNRLLSPDGSRQAAWDATPEHPFVLTTLATGETDTISVPQKMGWLEEGDWSPTGRTLALVSTDKAGSRWVLWAIDVATQQWHELASDTLPICPPRWSRVESAVYYLRDCDELRKVPVTPGGMPQGPPEILQTRLGASGFSISADGRKLVYTKDLSYTNIWLATRLRDRAWLTTTELTRGTAWKSGGRLSPDGRLVAFIQGVPDQGDLFVLPIEGGQPQRITSSGVATGMPAWSPDGDQLAFVATVSGKYKLRTIRLDRRGERTFASTEANPQLVWAPHRRILYQRSGNRNYHWLDVTTGAEQALVTNDSVGWMFFASPSPNGEAVAVSWNRAPEHRAYLVSLQDGSQRPVGPRRGRPLGWSADGAAVYVGDDQRRIWRVPARGGKELLAGTIPFKSAKSADCNLTDRSLGLILLCNVEQSVSDAWMMEDFDPALKR